MLGKNKDNNFNYYFDRSGRARGIIQMKKTILCLALAATFVFGGCGNKLEINSEGFYDNKNDIQYVPCAYLAVRPVQVGDEYATDGELTYYKIPWQDPTEFICDSVEGVSFVYRASTVDDVTINNFNPIGARVYVEGTSSVYIDSFYCAQEYLPDELKSDDLVDDSALIYSIRDSLIDDERVTINSDDILTDDMYHIRLLSADYPGLYYDVLFFTDANGEQYLEDRGTGEYVLARDDLVARMIGG
jgi:hypothetical protein